MKKSNDDDFLTLMTKQGVERQENQHKRVALINPRHKKGGKDPSLLLRRQAAQGGGDIRFPVRDVPIMNIFDPLEWKREGIQEGVYRNLRLGKYQIDARLDLMKRSPSQALDELLDFINQCNSLGIRTFLINFGRGGQQSEANQLRSLMNIWLPNIENVMAYHSAITAHGGLTALYVLLRKSEAQRQENWERHQKRG